MGRVDQLYGVLLACGCSKNLMRPESAWQGRRLVRCSDVPEGIQRAMLSRPTHEFSSHPSGQHLQWRALKRAAGLVSVFGPWSLVSCVVMFFKVEQAVHVGL